MTRREIAIFIAGVVFALGMFYLRLQWVLQVARIDRIENFLTQAFSK